MNCQDLFPLRNILKKHFKMSPAAVVTGILRAVGYMYVPNSGSASVIFVKQPSSPPTAESSK